MCISEFLVDADEFEASFAGARNMYLTQPEVADALHRLLEPADDTQASSAFERIGADGDRKQGVALAA